MKFFDNGARSITNALATPDKEFGVSPMSRPAAQSAPAPNQNVAEAGASRRDVRAAPSEPRGAYSVARAAPSERSASEINEEAVKLMIERRALEIEAQEVELGRLLHAGNLARGAGDYAAAMKAYEQAAKLQPDDGRAFYGLGNLYADQSKWDEAEKAYRRAVELNPYNFSARQALGYVLLQPRADGITPERRAAGELSLRAAAELVGWDAAAFERLIQSLEERGAGAAELESVYRSGLGARATSARAHLRLSRLLSETGREAEAERLFKIAAEQTHDADIAVGAAEWLEADGRYEKAEKQLRRVLSFSPNHPRALYVLGRVLVLRKRYKQAAELLGALVKVAPDDFAPRYLLGLAHLRARRPAEAEAVFNAAAALAPAGASESLALAYGLSGVGDAFLGAGRAADAVRAYARALELDPEDAETKLKLSELRAGGKP